MIVTLSAYVTLGLSVLIFILIFRYYWTVLRKINGVQVFHALPYIIRYQLNRKKEMPFTNFLFQLMADMYKKHAKDGFCWAYNVDPTFYIFSEEPIKMLLNEKAAIDKCSEYKILEQVIGSGLVTSNGKRWKKHRKLISPTFNLGFLKEKVPLFNDHAMALVADLKSLEGKESGDIIHFIKRHYFNAFIESIFGLKQSEVNKVETSKYFLAIDKLALMTMYRAFQPWLWPKFALKLLPSGKEYLKMHNDIDNFVKNVTLKMKNHVSSDKEPDNTEYFSKNLKKSFAYLLLQHHLKDPSFSFEDLHGEVNTFMAAGYDSVSYSTIWCLFMLGLHPEIQEKAFQEVQSACHNYISYEDMHSFTYLEAFIMETLRLYPTVPIFARSLSQDVQFGKTKVLKGTSIVYSVYFWHRNPDIYPDPEKFDPERFLSTEGRKPWMHIPFAEGNRGCIGKMYALMKMKIFLAHILSNYKITALDKREDVQLCYNVVLTPAKPLRMLITPRSSTQSS